MSVGELRYPEGIKRSSYDRRVRRHVVRCRPTLLDRVGLDGMLSPAFSVLTGAGHQMDVKEAVAKAKSYIAQVFSDEGTSGYRLEEVEYDKLSRAWLITLGMIGPYADSATPRFATMVSRPPPRTYKIVRIPEDGDDHPSIKIRRFEDE